jgi:hypothetical protein
MICAAGIGDADVKRTFKPVRAKIVLVAAR